MKKWWKQILCLLVIAFAMNTVLASDTIGQRYRVGEIQDEGSITARVVKSLVSVIPYPSESSNLSRFFLSSIFGEVSGALDGERGGLVALLFRVFNLGIFGIASLLVVYASVFSVSTTSHDGGALGSGRFSPFSIARVIGSMAALLPTFGGYSLVQVIVMKMIVSGTVIADIAWEASLDYLSVKGGDALLESKAPPDKAHLLLSEKVKLGDGDNPGYRDYRINQAESEYPVNLNTVNAAILDSLSMIKPCATVIDGYVGSQVRYRFLYDRIMKKASEDVKEEKITVKMLIEADNVRKTVDCFDVSLYWPMRVTEGEFVNNENFSRALRTYIVSAANGVLAERQKDSKIKLFGDRKIAKIFATKLRTFYQTVRSGSLDNLEVKDTDTTNVLKAKGWAAAGIHFDDLLNIDQSGEEDDGGFSMPKFSEEGANLRSFEYQLNDNVLKPKEISASVLLESGGSIYDPLKGFILAIYQEKYLGVGDDAIQPKNLMEWLYQLIKPNRENGDTLIATGDGSYMKNADSKRLSTGVFTILSVNAIKGVRPYKMGPITIDASVVIDETMSMSAGVTEAVIRTLYGKDIKHGVKDGPKNPIMAAQLLGDKVLSHTVNYFRKSTERLYEEVTVAQQSAYGIVVGLTLLKGIMKGWVARNKGKLEENPSMAATDREALSREAAKADAMNKFTGIVTDPIMYLIEFAQSAAKAIIGVYLPLGNGMAVVYFVSGVILAAYIPFAPTLIYLFSILAWVFAVIEAMIAAPIVMIGFAHPEGHEMLGKAEQGMMLLMGVFVRPFVTLIGFMLAITLSVSILKAFNTMFAIGSMFFFRNAMQVNHPIPLMFAVSGFVLLYAYALMVILQQCYSMIYVIPDQILKWVGGPAESAGAGVASAMRSLSTGLSEKSQSAATGAGQATRGATGISTSHM